MDTLLVMDHKLIKATFNGLESWLNRKIGESVEQFNRRLAANPNYLKGSGYVRNKDLELQVLGDKITRDPKISWRFNGSVFLGIYWRPYNIDLLHAVYNDLIMTERGRDL